MTETAAAIEPQNINVVRLPYFASTALSDNAPKIGNRKIDNKLYKDKFLTTIVL